MRASKRERERERERKRAKLKETFDYFAPSSTEFGKKPFPRLRESGFRAGEILRNLGKVLLPHIPRRRRGGGCGIHRHACRCGDERGTYEP